MFVIASDHGGLELKEAIKDLFSSRGLVIDDIGTLTNDSVDYPDYAQKLATAICRGQAEQGILICGTGIGMSIAANKFPGIRAALVFDEFTARMAREHNNANILVMGGRVLQAEQALRMVETWLDTPFEGGRHQARLDKIAAIEQGVKDGRI